MVFACIDIGGTNTLVGVGNDEFEIVEKVQSKEFLANVQGELQRILEQTSHDMDEMEVVAIAAAGPIDREKGVFYPPNIDVDRVDLRSPFKELDAEMRIVNDCSSAALGEYVYGSHDAEDLVYLTLSTGIGAGIIIDGNLIEGRNGNFGEVGHIVIADEGRECGCGGHDHWEAYCGGSNLPRMAEDLFGYEFNGARDVFDQYYQGDEAAAEVIEAMQQYNARGIASLVNSFDPAVIAVGGGVALNHSEAVVDGLQDVVEQESVNGVPRIELCSLEDEAVIHGLRAVCNGKA